MCCNSDLRESDEVTPAFVREAAIASLQKGKTFYAHNLLIRP